MGMTGNFLTRDQVRRVDRVAIDEFGFLGLVLMENAGRGCADLLCHLGIRGPVIVCCGKGNNGGDGFVIARHLLVRGYETRVLLWNEPAAFVGDAAANLTILQKLGADLRYAGSSFSAGWLETELRGADWTVDALLGTGATGTPRSPVDQILAVLNKPSSARRLAVDLPSGLDCDTGMAASATFRADHTATFVAAKQGFSNPDAEPWLGQVHVLDIGVPQIVVARVLALRGESTAPGALP
jgi:NAD(P)H-hydrate epimerase